MISQSQINDVISKIVTYYKPEKILLFGSYANGTATEDSDLDLLVVKNSDLPRYKRALELRRYLRPFKFLFPIDLLVFTNEELVNQSTSSFSFANDVLSTCKIVYEKK
ncbi:MAG: hypothetical protein A2033_17625 [Bacteroidetes bacterium GWA2_31_9]|nr:MAG: hypothetical protein A2033_17625 [Bacteroidetes bacterium GWA2_31_9]